MKNKLSKVRDWEELKKVTELAHWYMYSSLVMEEFDLALKALLLSQLQRVEREVEGYNSLFDYYEGEQEDYPYPGDVVSEVQQGILKKLKQLEDDIRRGK